MKKYRFSKYLGVVPFFHPKKVCLIQPVALLLILEISAVFQIFLNSYVDLLIPSIYLHFIFAILQFEISSLMN